MKIQLKRSNVLENGLAKAPNSEQMEYGEVAVNYNSTDPAMFIKDSANGIIRISNLNGAAVPDINDPALQPGTLDDRYLGLKSWSNVPLLSTAPTS